MDLYCIEGPKGLGDQKIILPNECRLLSVELFKSESSDEKPFPGIEDNIEKSKQICVKRLDNIFDITKFWHSVQQNMECLEDSTQYFCGTNDQKVFLGPVLQVIRRSTFAKFSENKLIFFDKNPIDNKEEYSKDTQLLITPNDVEEDNKLLLVFSNGCVVVMAGGYLLVDLPVVIVRPNGDYFTISGCVQDTFTLKTGTHLAIVIDLQIPLPVVFIRTNQPFIKIKSKTVIKDNNKDESNESLH